MSDFMLHAPQGANRPKRRVGRGSSSGLGSTAGKGNKGQQSRSGSAVPYVGFEGGQMPLYRRIARRGFSNARFKKEFSIFNLKQLEEKYADGETVNRESLKAKGLLSKNKTLIKILGDGDITKKLNIDVDKVSASAKEKIEKVGGSVKVAEEADKAKAETK
ncbi:MAG: 50S ribosomal protein L15 [Treponema sp.]|jgi:large subunit ribosomal protein L15|nr:50S ribosomal protein L15 [Treponema sp.]MBQ1591206.1 50S ribosomal protein L15 [Treponema sp.]MBQ1671920.1 50S ribosomal protein L15 [Treponema sp.]MBQ1713429.1 50S ribosomal protein L15 [Treponema sp.]MBQ1726647.1 50S ribosomal protein L15 [Treponema sp.]